MRPELSIISFLSLSVLLLIVTLFALRILKTNTPTCLLLSWLIVVQFVHGVNAAIWFNNEQITASLWCDIVTKLSLGAIVAVPSNCISIARRASIPEDEIYARYPSARTRVHPGKVVEFALGIIIPIVFMCLHPIVQDYRFLIIKDLGCTASVFPSVTALLVFWLPLLIFCVGTIVCSGFILHQIRSDLHREHKRDAYLQLSFVFFAMAMSSLIAFIQILAPTWVPNSSFWTNAHASFSDIRVLRHPNASFEATWWLQFIITLAFFALCFSPLIIKRQNLRSLLLPTHSTPNSPVRERSSSLSIPRPEPVHVQLKSGWDSMLDSSPAGRSPPSPSSMFRIRSVLAINISLTRKGSPTPSVKSRSSTEEHEGPFSEAAMKYLVSRSLGFNPLSVPIPSPPPPPPNTPLKNVCTPPPTPITPPKPAYTSPPPNLPSFIPSITPPNVTHLRPSTDTHSTTTLTLTSTSTSILIPTPDVPEDARSTLSALLTHDWPLPPPTTPPTPARSSSGSSSDVPNSPVPRLSEQSFTSSPRPKHMSSCSTDTYGFALYPTGPGTRPTSPFQDSAVSMAEIRPLELVTKGIHGRLRKKRAAQQGVLMTVVQETC